MCTNENSFSRVDAYRLEEYKMQINEQNTNSRLSIIR